MRGRVREDKHEGGETDKGEKGGRKGGGVQDITWG